MTSTGKTDSGAQEGGEKRETAVLVVSVFIISACALFYELLISSVSSYFLGNSILHFSITIGLFMFFMGVGSFLSKYLERDLLDRFVFIELLIGLVGGFSTAFLYSTFAVTEYYYLAAFIIIAAVSTLIGLEIPLVTRIVREHHSLKDALAHVLAVDYLGALVASVAFPLVMLPYLGLMKTALLIGILNIFIALVNIAEFKHKLQRTLSLLAGALLSLLMLMTGMFYSFSISSFFERFLYQDEIVYAEQTPYQRIVITKFRDDVRLFLDGSLQMCSIDEYRYHEPLVHIPMASARTRQDVLILGGGDGLAVREVLKHGDVRGITLVDIDEKMVELARTHALLTSLNQHSLSHPSVKIVAKDAYRFLQEESAIFPVIIIDLPDPSSLSLGKLYSREFYELARRRLSEDGVLVTQSGSPYFAREPFWCIHHTLEEVFPFVRSYQTYVPSFGPWGFTMASRHELSPRPERLNASLRFLHTAAIDELFRFDPDMAEVETEVNRLDSQVLVQYYEKSWEDWN